VFGLYGDVGLGIYYAQIEAETTFLGQTITADDDEVGLTMRFAPGVFYQLSPQLRLGAEFGVNPFFGDVDQTYFNISGMLSYRF
jgi:hypothetical protein